MSGLRLLAIGALALGAVILIASLAVPTCRNYAGTARDSGYPCKLDRSSGATEFILSRSSTLSVPLATPLAIALLIGGGIGFAKSRPS